MTNSAVPYRWCAGGDVNAFFGLAVDNMTNLVVLAGLWVRDLSGEAARTLEIVRVLGNGFILSALLWGSGVALIVARRLLAAASVFAVASVASLCGVIHSPLETSGLFWPWGVGPDGRDCWPRPMDCLRASWCFSPR